MPPGVGLEYPDPPLTDGEVRLRPWTVGDVGCVRQAGADPAIRVGTTVPAVSDPQAALDFIERQRERLDRTEGVSLAVADACSDEAVGAAVLMLRPQAGVMGIGYWIVPRARGRGLAARAVGLLSDWALAERRAARVEAWVEPDNVASQRVLTAGGFRREGILRSFLAFGDRRSDAVVFARTAGDRAAEPPLRPYACTL